MQPIILRVVDGADRGRVYSNLKPPITIGREEGNDIQLNDERVSRFHVRIQAEPGNVMLADLGSTNGTKVNGERVSLKKLRYGDIIQIGRSCFLFGSREQIDARYAKLRELYAGNFSAAQESISDLLEKYGTSAASALRQKLLNESAPPALPASLSPGQIAELNEMLEFFHHRLHQMISSSDISEEGQKATLSFESWQLLLDLQSHVAEYLQKLVDPNSGDLTPPE